MQNTTKMYGSQGNRQDLEVINMVDWNLKKCSEIFF